MVRRRRSLPLPRLGWLLLIAVGLGLTGASGVVSSDDRVRADTTEVLPAALVGALIALLVGVLVVRLMRSHAVVDTLGPATVLAVMVAAGGLLGVTFTAESIAETPAESEVADEQEDSDALSRTASGTTGDARREGNDIDITDLEGSAMLVIGLGLLIAAGVFLMRRSELRAVERDAVYLSSDLTLDDDEAEPTATDDAIAAALDRSLRELLNQADPRTAIRAAYATLLEELATIGLRRHVYEGPAEHIRRCLEPGPPTGRLRPVVTPEPGGPAGEPRLPAESINELLHLFEIARFSERPVTEAHAERARQLLASAADALAGAHA